jgi:hypothetical protein
MRMHKIILILEFRENNSIRKINPIVTEKIIDFNSNPKGIYTGQDQIGMNNFIINKVES